LLSQIKGAVPIISANAMQLGTLVGGHI